MVDLEWFPLAVQPGVGGEVVDEGLRSGEGGE